MTYRQIRILAVALTVGLCPLASLAGPLQSAGIGGIGGGGLRGMLRPTRPAGRQNGNNGNNGNNWQQPQQQRQMSRQQQPTQYGPPAVPANPTPTAAPSTAPAANQVAPKQAAPAAAPASSTASPAPGTAAPAQNVPQSVPATAPAPTSVAKPVTPAKTDSDFVPWEPPATDVNGKPAAPAAATAKPAVPPPLAPGRTADDDPVVDKGGATDLVLEDVEFAEPPTLVAGPAYRVLFRNQGFKPSGKFRVAVIASAGEKPAKDAPRTVVEVPSLAPGQAGEATVRLPRSAVKATTADPTRNAFTHVVVAIDMEGTVVESDKANNIAVLERSKVDLVKTVDK